MSHKQEIEVSSLFKNRLSESSDPGELVKEVITEEEINNLLNQYDHWAGARGDIYNAEIINIEVDKTGTGFMEVEYEVHYYFGCDDMNKEYEEDMIIDIELQGNTIILTGINEVIREPDEY